MKRTQQEVLLTRENLSFSAQIQDLKDSLQCVEHDLGVEVDVRQQLQESVSKNTATTTTLTPHTVNLTIQSGEWRHRINLCKI